MGAVLREVDVCAVVDQHDFNSFTFKVIALCFVVVIFEGYDIAAMAFALPGLAKDWDIRDLAAFGPVLAASMIGMMIGSAFFGYLGDRAGRRRAIIISSLLFAVFTGLILIATTVPQLLALRLAAGIGLGGAAPNAIALTSEFAPVKHRSFATTVMFSGIGLGGALPGLAATLLIADYGWKSLFLIGCIMPLVVALACAIWLPESPTYLVTAGRRAEALRVLRRLSPTGTEGILPDSLSIRTDGKGQGVGFRALFSGGLARPTMLFWAATIGNFMTYYVLLNWTPTLFTLFNLKPLAAIGQTVFQFGGVAGGIAVGYLLGRRGVAVMGSAMLFSIVPTVAIGLIGGHSAALLLLAEFVAGFCILGTAYGFGALGAMIYPTSIRSNGTGCGLGAGRFGSVVSTIAAGQLVGAGIPLTQILQIASVPLLISGLACLALAGLLGGRQGTPSNTLQPAH